eukprot:5237003-Pleurochrysis_carterae.AAC.2
MCLKSALQAGNTLLNSLCHRRRQGNDHVSSISEAVRDPRRCAVGLLFQSAERDGDSMPVGRAGRARHHAL